MPLAQGTGRKYTFNDYLSWPDDEHWELIDGEPYAMAPAPSVKHQRVVVRLASILEPMLTGGPCTLFVAPTDLVLSELDIVQPDVFVVCDPKKITDANIRGAPDLVFELLSPSTALKDKKTKRNLYQHYGIPEYVVVDPEGQYVERMTLGADGTYDKADLLGPDELLQLHSLKEVSIPLREVFEVEEQKEERGEG